MTRRDQFLTQMAGPPPAPALNWEFAFWETTLPAWQTQGLPGEINTPPQAFRYFGIESPHFGEGYFVPMCANLRLCPAFPSQCLGEHNGQELRMDADGVKYVQLQEGQQTIPHYVEHPLKGRREWEEIFQPRLDPRSPGRFSEINWPAVNEDFARRGYPRFLYLDSFMGYLRNLMGFEAFAMLPYDDPALLEEMVEALTRIKEAFLDRLPGRIQLDMVHFWEDICYNAGPIINPAIFRRIVVPRIHRVVTRLRQEFGCRYFSVDTDGNFLQLIEGWIEAGINILMPCEVDAGMDVLLLQERYGDRCGFHGGIQKKALIAGPSAINAELERIRPAARRGGYIPHLDHGCPANVSLENYRYYLQMKRKILNCA